MTRPYMISISGGSGSGKSSFVSELIKGQLKDKITILSLDNYYKDLSHLSEAEKEKVNFDHPSSLDTELLFANIKKLSSGKAINDPIYDFKSHERAKKTNKLKANPIVLIDGIFSCHYEQINSLLDLKIYIELDKDIRFLRRLLRDTKERGRTLAGVCEQYLSSVRPMHEEFVEQGKKKADLIIPWENINHHAVKMLRALVNEKI